MGRVYLALTFLAAGTGSNPDRSGSGRWPSPCSTRTINVVPVGCGLQVKPVSSLRACVGLPDKVRSQTLARSSTCGILRRPRGR
jgi:hypothetical protein